LKLLYFAWIREKIGHAEEDIPLPSSVHDVETLLSWLSDQYPHIEEILSDKRSVRVAVNQEHAQPTTPVSDTDEVALFPPVTGG